MPCSLTALPVVLSCCSLCDITLLDQVGIEAKVDLPVKTGRRSCNAAKTPLQSALPLVLSNLTRVRGFSGCLILDAVR